MTDTQSNHGKRDEKAFRGNALGEAKTRAEAIGKEQRTAFADIVRMLEALHGDGFEFDPAQVTFHDDVDQAAWRRFILPSNLRSSLEPPLMDTEETILRAVHD